MGHHRAGVTTRPRYGRMTAAGGAVLITALAVLGDLGVLPSSPSVAAPVPRTSHTARAAHEPGGGAMALSAVDPRVADPTGEPTGEPTADQVLVPGVPSGSGTGRRVVFDMSDQRVWLVGREAGHDAVRRSYLVSGSVTDNLAPGSYQVYSRSRHAVGFDDSGTMDFMVRFTRGRNAAIGFHDIPMSDDGLVQSRADLGTPQSHGCIRQWRPDAKALWDFASLGTPVVVVA